MQPTGLSTGSQSAGSQQRLTAHYKTTFGVLVLVGGALSLIVGLSVILQGGGLSPLAPLGALLLLVGSYCVRHPYFLLEPRQITVYRLFGIATKRYTFESWEVVKADDRRIYIDDDGITKTVPVMPWLVNADDWRTMRKMLVG